MSIRSLTDQILTEADRRRIEESDVVSVPTPPSDEQTSATQGPKVGLVDPHAKPHLIPGGIAARFKIRQGQALETFVKEASLPVSPPPEVSGRSEEELGDEADTAPIPEPTSVRQILQARARKITIELQSH